MQVNPIPTIRKCVHGCYIPSDDWILQARARIPESQRVAWSCWMCKEYDLPLEYGMAALVQVVQANQTAGGWARLWERIQIPSEEPAHVEAA
jgi:hypothetical protein